MLKMYDFVCVCGQRTEKLVGYETTQVPCGGCGEIALKAISAPKFKLEGWSGNFPSAANQFDRIHREKLRAEQKANS